MVHCLYKCFCKFRAIDGQRFEFSNAKIDVIEQPTYTKKRQYTFERSKDEPAYKTAKVSNYINATCTSSMDDNDYSSCRRVRVVATNHHKILNRARSEDIRRRIRKIEQELPGLKILLRNRVKRSIALPEVCPLVTVNDSNRDNSGISNENNSMMEKNKSDPMEQSIEKSITSSSFPVNDSFKVDANSNKYRARFNNIIMKTMQGISHKLKTMTALPSPVNKAFYYMQWKHFLQAFNADRIYIWEVQLNTKEVLLVVTDKNIMPIVSDAMYVINIKAVSTERLPLLPKLIKLGVVNEETEKMSILLFGINNYWRVLGVTHSENDFMNHKVIAVPTPDTNPRLASKISYLFNDMVQLTAKNRSKESSTTSNICIRQLDVADIDNIHVPIPVVGCHRWLMLSLANDFSHIFVPSWKQFISHKKILCAIDHAKKTQKTVRMGPTSLKPQVYVPHDSQMKIFFGPMQKNETFDLQLLQQTDGKMLLREDYQRITQEQPKVLTIGTWLYMKDDHMVLDEHTPDTQIRTYPPKVKYFPKSSSTPQGFIPLKPSTVTSNNLNITLIPSTSSDGFSKCTTSTPTTSSGNIPSSELIRHLSLGLRARPAKVLNKSNFDTSPIKVVDTSLLMSPQYLPTSSSSWTSSTSTSNAPKSSYLVPAPKREQATATTIQSKPITLSFAPNMQSTTDWKDVSKGVPIRKRRFTTIVSDGKPTLKSILQRPIIDKPSKTVELPSNVRQNNSAMSKQVAQSIRERRYTTIVSTGAKPLFKNNSPNVRPPTNVKNFELVQNPGNKLTLAPIPVTESPTQLIINRPVIIKKIDSADSIAQPTSLRQRSKTIDRSNKLQPHRPLSPSNQQTNARPTTTTSTIVSKLSTAPIVVIKPSSLNLSFPKKVSTPHASNALDGKSVIMKKLPLPTLRLMPSNIKILGKNKISRNITEIIDSDDETAPPPPKKLLASSNSMSTGTNNTVNGYLVSQIRGLGKIMAKKLFAAYSVNLLDGSKLFHTFKHCTDYLNNV